MAALSLPNHKVTVKPKDQDRDEEDSACEDNVLSCLKERFTRECESKISAAKKKSLVLAADIKMLTDQREELRRFDACFDKFRADFEGNLAPTFDKIEEVIARCEVELSQQNRKQNAAQELLEKISTFLLPVSSEEVEEDPVVQAEV